MISIRENELLRHPAYSRVVHWSYAIFFVLALLSGFAIYSPWLFHGLTPLFGGGPMTRLLHPWFSLGFVAAFALQILNWLAPMTWTSDDRRWLKGLKTYVTNAEPLEPEYVVLGGGNAKRLEHLPENVRLGRNEDAFLGGFRLWVDNSS